MSDILQNIHVNGSNAEVMTALTTIDGLSKWWTSTTEGSSAPGEVIGFRFGEHVSHARVDEVGDSRMAWTFEGSNPDWEGTRVTFDLEQVDGKTLVRFGHLGWREANTFFGHCSMKWATFLLSLKALVEDGQGRPFPNDIAI